MIEPGQLRRWNSIGHADAEPSTEKFLFVTLRPAQMEFASTISDKIWWVLYENGERWFFADDIEFGSEIVEKE